MSAVTDAYLATSPLRYFPLDETSGTNANNLVGGADGTCVGMTMGGTDAPGGIGGKAPVFTGGSERILLSSAKILGGLANWSIAAWVRYDVAAGDNVSRRFYGEANPTAGNDQLAGAITGSTSSKLRIYYGADPTAPVERGPTSIFIRELWTFIVFTRSGVSQEFYWNCGRRQLRVDGVASSTWTDAGIVTWIGNLPRAGSNPWIGSVAHLALYDRVLSQADQLSLYEPATPLQRPLLATKIFSRPTSIWNQDLTVPGNEPTITADSAATASKLAAQAAAYSTGANASTGPMWVADNTDPLVRVRIMGGQENISNSHPDLYDAMGNIRMPAGFSSNFTSDREAQIYNEDTDQLWEFFLMSQTLMPTWISSVIEGAGTLAAGSHTWFVIGSKADGSTGPSYPGSTTRAVNGSQGVRLYWTEIEDADHYVVYRDNLIIAGNVPIGTQTLLDTGLATSPAGPVGNAVTTDWGTLAGGWIEDVGDNVGHYEPPHTENWGVAGSQLPLWAGTVSLTEARAGLIDHALAMALPEILTGYVYPAQDSDGWYTGGNAILEGARIQLDPDYNVATIPGAFEQMCAVAMQTYGAYIRDVTNEVSIYVEDSVLTGRDMWTEVYEGRYDFELFEGFPWTSVRVIEPSWTLAQTEGAPPPPLPSATGAYWGTRI